MATIVIEVAGSEALRAKLQRINGGVLDLKSPMSSIGRYLTGFFSGEVFASRGGVIGDPWRPLSAHYAAYKARTFPGRPPLLRRGTMNRSFRSRAARASVVIYNSDEKFEFHQLGTRNIPARTMMAIDETRARRVVDMIDGYLDDLARSA